VTSKLGEERVIKTLLDISVREEDIRKELATLNMQSNDLLEQRKSLDQKVELPGLL